MDYNNLDLRKQTFLDYTNDSELIDEIVSDKDWFLAHLSEQSLAFSWIDYAEYIQDEKLIAMVEKEFQTVFDSFFNE